MLAKKTNFIFIDADDFHPNSNKEKMKNGIPLSEEDRIPWLETLRNVLRQCLEDKKSTILGCSALQKQFREILRSADPNYVPQSYVSSTVKFVLLDATAEVLAARLEKRAAQGKHFMPSTLLKSQLELLQIDDLEILYIYIVQVLCVQDLSQPLSQFPSVWASKVFTQQLLVCVVTQYNRCDTDDFHPNSNKEKMKNGIPLAEADRIPWLETLPNVLRKSLQDKISVILGYSALQKRYREILRSADPNYVPQSYCSNIIMFVLLDVVAEMLQIATEEIFFMLSTLLDSQLELLQIDDSESILMVDASLAPQIIVETIRTLIIMKMNSLYFEN
ncbi:uncharacterized protein LOC133778847 [Humulus lupulus]|uniref:uncharacterized protein LOC133778847 n=1 Tax=Humulus lupulus TaxID=3486 RepID=UPI002B40A574|nr:uncharacterized protein LOC133778847 [Humulus lupulus]